MLLYSIASNIALGAVVIDLDVVAVFVVAFIAVVVILICAVVVVVVIHFTYKYSI